MSEAPTPSEEHPIAPAPGEEHPIAPIPSEKHSVAPPDPEEESVMPDTQTVIQEEEDQWAQEPMDELPPRPRRRLLGTGSSPVPLALLGVLLIACGFIGGVLVEKGQTSSPSGGAAAGLASRLAALRGAGGAGSTATGGASSSSTGAAGTGGGSAAGGGFAGRFGGLAGGATIGEVSYVSGNTLYVVDAEGNTVKVTTSPASAITKTVKADLHGIHPGETVVVRGPKGSGGAVSAESISVGAEAGGLSSLFGGGGGARGGGGGSAGGGGPALFGS